MRVAVMVLIVLGLVAAGAAAMLVRALKSEVPNKDGVARVSVLVADVNLPARTRLTRQHVMVEQVPQGSLPQGYLSDQTQAVGKVLKVPVIKGQPLTLAHLIAKDSIDDLLRPGMLAFPAPLPRRSTSTDLLYPGCIVDVFATFPLRSSSKGEAVVTPLLQNIQILAVEDNTVIPPANEKEGTEAAARKRTASSSMNVMVTLEVTARQAAALQLVLEQGTLGLAMRNPNDKSINPMEPMIVKEGQLTSASQTLDPQTLTLFSSLQQILGNRAAAGSEASAAPTAEIPQAVQQKNPAWRMTVIHGRKVEETEIELRDEPANKLQAAAPEGK
jgi:pilus assembly protein CpaB